MALTETRRNEIAYLLIKNRMGCAEITLGRELRDRCVDVAGEINVPPDELIEFTRNLVTELLTESFVPKKSLVSQRPKRHKF